MADKIDDFGEYIQGAKKERYGFLAADLNSAESKKLSLAKLWPKKEIDEIQDKEKAAIAHVLRDSMPSKPRKQTALIYWYNDLGNRQEVIGLLLDDKLDTKTCLEKLGKSADGYHLAAKMQFLMGIDRDKWQSVGGFYQYDVKQEQQIKIDTYINKVNVFVKGNNQQEAFDKLKEQLNKTVEQQNTKGATTRSYSFSIYSRRQKQEDPTKQHFIACDADKQKTPLVYFSSLQEARAYKAEHHSELNQLWEEYKELNNIKKSDMRLGENRERVGEDYRNGKDISPQEFMDTFNIRGGQFGNWVEDNIRTQILNETYDAFMDLAKATNIPPKAIGLNGTLGIAFGARGSGWASAHYERTDTVINLTKTRGAGSLAHEWWHALDNYMSGNKAKLATELSTYGSHMPFRHNELAKPIEDLKTTMYHTELYSRSCNADSSRNQPYFSSKTEMSARAFESYVLEQLKGKETQNDYLVNIRPIEQWHRNKDSYPYLLVNEIERFNQSYHAIFDALQLAKAFEHNETQQNSTNPADNYKRDVNSDYDELLKKVESLSENDLHTLLSLKETPIYEHQPYLDSVVSSYEQLWEHNTAKGQQNAIAGIIHHYNTNTAHEAVSAYLPQSKNNQAYKEQAIIALDKIGENLSQRLDVAYQLAQSKITTAQPNIAQAQPSNNKQQNRSFGDERLYLYTTFKDLQAMRELKQQGIVRFDTQNKVWYARPEHSNKVSQWTNQPSIPTPQEAFVDFLREHGIDVPAGHPKDGSNHRLSNNGSTDKNVIYNFYPNQQVPAAYVENFSRGEQLTWTYPTEYLNALKNIEAVEKAKGNSYTPPSYVWSEDKKQSTLNPAKINQEQQAKHEQMAYYAKMIVAICSDANEHNYLNKKQVGANGVVKIVPHSQNLPKELQGKVLIGDDFYKVAQLRKDNPDKLVLQRGNLIIPQYNNKGELRAFETIAYNGGKYALKDGEKQGLRTVLGELKNGKPIVIAEGYATGATLHEHTKQTVVVAFGKNGLLDVAQSVREQYPDSKIYIGADNDHSKAQNVGLIDAQKVTQAVSNSYMLVPQFEKGENGKDWNDVYVDKGLSEFKRQLTEQLRAINPSKVKPTKNQDPLEPSTIKQNYPTMSDENLKNIQAWREHLPHKYADDPNKIQAALARLANALPRFANGEQLPAPKTEQAQSQQVQAQSPTSSSQSAPSY